LNYQHETGDLFLSVIPGYNYPAEFSITVMDEDGDSATAKVVFKPSITTGLGALALQIPENYLLEQNYPNPFNPSTKIRFGLPAESHVKISVYNLLGQLITVIVNEVKSAGYYERRWYAAGLSSGVYIYRLYAEATDKSISFSQVKKMVLLR
jgi:hypothetical protein